MARRPDLNSATSQFFINHADNKQLDTMGGGYCAFGLCLRAWTSWTVSPLLRPIT